MAKEQAAMLVISSMRRFGQDPEWDRNQMMAFRTWNMFAKKIILFGDRDPYLANRKVLFVPTEEFPRIKLMADLAGRQRMEYVTLCNGDILLDPAIMRIEARMRAGNFCCASSRRWHFDPTMTMEKARETASLINQDGFDDRGRDVFIARWDVWQRIAKEMPDHYRIGHQHWDAYLTNAFREHWNDKFIDFTAMRLVHHPHHSGRRMPYAETIKA